MSSRQRPTTNDLRHRHVLVNRNCIALVLQRAPKSSADQEDGHAIFADFLSQNSTCFWNACLMRSVAGLEYRGCLLPSTLLVSGTNFALEVVRSAWARRVLRPPKGYTIGKLGDVGTVDMLPMPQTQFAPLSEALCRVVADLNGDRTTATTDSIRAALGEGFPEMQVPCDDILHKTLGALIRERKLYHTGNGYFVVSPDTYRQRAVSPLCERQMLMTNEEAIVRLHGENRQKECSLAVQVNEMDIAAAWKCSASSFLQARNTSTQFTQVPSSPDLQLLERSHSLRVLRVKGRPKTNNTGANNGTTMDKGGSVKEPRIGYLNDLDSDMNIIHKTSEKQSVLAKILKRMQFLTDKSAKHVVFSAQFPPMEWLDSSDDRIRCHSVATQTLQQKVGAKQIVKCLEPTGPRIPWEETPNNLDLKDYAHYVSPIVNHRRLYNTESDGSSPRKNTNPTKQRYSPSHRYSHHGTFTNNHSKKRHRHRRSSSESPKAQKNLISNCHSQSTSSRSNSEDKAYRSSSSGSVLVAPKGSNKSKSSKARAVDNNCVLKDQDVRSPSDSCLDREVLKDVKNSIPTTKKIDNIPDDVSGKIYEQKKDDKPSPITMDQSCSEKSVSCNSSSADQMAKPEIFIQPLVLKGFVDIPAPKPVKVSPKEILVDNSVSVEVALEKNPSSPKSRPNNVSTTIVTEETTVTKANGNSKVVTVTSITTSLSHGGLKDVGKRTSSSPDQEEFLESSTFGDKEKSPVNDLNIETEKGARIIDCSSSCNIVTEVK